MRVILDTNIIISALVSPSENSPASQIVQAFFWQKFVLLLPEELLAEFVRTVIEKRRLRKRVTVRHIETLVQLLTSGGEIIPPISEKIPAVTRDPKDDYLPAYALSGKAHYLVTGDQDLLQLKQIGPVKIISPREFISTLTAKRQKNKVTSTIR
jgi:uncharacterized protein